MPHKWITTKYIDSTFLTCVKVDIIMSLCRSHILWAAHKVRLQRQGEKWEKLWRKHTSLPNLFVEQSPHGPPWSASYPDETPYRLPASKDTHQGVWPTASLAFLPAAVYRQHLCSTHQDCSHGGHLNHTVSGPLPRIDFSKKPWATHRQLPQKTRGLCPQILASRTDGLTIREPREYVQYIDKAL